MKRLGKNQGGYFGETIDIDRLLSDDLEAARRFGWQIDHIPVSDNLNLLAFRRMVQAPRSWEGRHGRRNARERVAHGGPLRVLLVLDGGARRVGRGREQPLDLGPAARLRPV